MNYTIKTTPMPDGKIEQELTSPSLSFAEGAREEVMRWVMDTKEKGIRDALIALGWTPPADGERQ